MCKQEGFKWRCGCTHEWWNVCEDWSGEIAPCSECPASGSNVQYTPIWSCCSTSCCQLDLEARIQARRAAGTGHPLTYVINVGIRAHTGACFLRFRQGQGLSNELRMKKGKPLVFPVKLDPKCSDAPVKPELVQAIDDLGWSYAVQFDTTLFQLLSARALLDLSMHGKTSPEHYSRSEAALQTPVSEYQDRVGAWLNFFKQTLTQMRQAEAKHLESSLGDQLDKSWREAHKRRIIAEEREDDRLRRVWVSTEYQRYNASNASVVSEWIQKTDWWAYSPSVYKEPGSTALIGPPPFLYYAPSPTAPDSVEAPESVDPGWIYHQLIPLHEETVAAQALIAQNSSSASLF